MGQEEIVFFQISEDGEILPGRFSGSRTLNGNRNENSHQGCPEQRDLHQVISEECPGNVSLGPETCDMRPRLIGEMAHQGKKEGKPTEASHEEQSKFREDYHQQGRKKSEKVSSRMLLKMPEDKMAMIHEPGYGSETQQRKETAETPYEPIMLSEGQGSSTRETATHVWVKKLFFQSVT
ncbi:hypothetical protein JD844_013734 [Phrynosoma platyrhinos]|uniref:Uncharacterized protein n=1 Tax=Phrynosoma platyrhinos TaxID=52577 RepID=A0ABQ7TMA0_PHRPL|nr:hypothetical protein JD844_013734 [Phrynosoma platyrhinos]